MTVGAESEGRITRVGARFDRSDLARVVVRGGDRREFLQRVATNDLSGLEAGRGVFTLLLERTGRLVDRLLLLERGDDFLAIGSPGRTAAIVEWLDKYTIADDVQSGCADEGGRLFTILGPRAAILLRERTGIDAGSMAIGDHRRIETPEGEATLVRAEDVGSPSFHVVGSAAACDHTMIGLEELPLVDAAVWDALRIAAGVPVWGRELGDRTIPLEAGLQDAISFTKGCYIGQEVIARLHNYGRAKRELVRLEIAGDVPPVNGAALMQGDREIGEITSAAFVEDRVWALASLLRSREASEPLRLREDPDRTMALATTSGGDLS